LNHKPGDGKQFFLGKTRPFTLENEAIFIHLFYPAFAPMSFEKPVVLACGSLA
jgi:hypothetical protein